MKKGFLFFTIIGMLTLLACSKTTAPALVGKWVLTKSCACNACSDTIAFYQSQTLVFSSGGQVQLYGSVGSSERHYSGTYSISQQASGELLNINLGGPDSVKNFLFIPGSVIVSETVGALVLALSTPFGNPCAYVNTYTAVPN